MSWRLNPPPSTVAPAQLLDRGDLVLRQQIRADVVEAELCRNGARRSFAVAGEHHNLLDALTAKQIERVPDELARPVGHGDDADRLGVARDDDGGAADRAHVADAVVNRRRAQLPLLE